MNETGINYEALVRTIYPHATIKKIGVDNGHNATPMYAVFKYNSTLIGDCISIPTIRRKHAYKSSYLHLKQQGKL